MERLQGGSLRILVDLPKIVPPRMRGRLKARSRRVMDRVALMFRKYRVYFV